VLVALLLFHEQLVVKPELLQLAQLVQRVLVLLVLLVQLAEQQVLLLVVAP
jgi:hypothetical protein